MIKPQPQHLQSLIKFQTAKDGCIIVFLDYEEDKREPRRKAKKRDVALKGPV
jgi:5-formyltetrahydrofolate cyclo-ligase